MAKGVLSISSCLVTDCRHFFFFGGQALEMIRKHNFSAAIFAPGWVYETQEKTKFRHNQDKWGQYCIYCCRHTVRRVMKFKLYIRPQMSCVQILGSSVRLPGYPQACLFSPVRFLLLPGFWEGHLLERTGTAGVSTSAYSPKY